MRLGVAEKVALIWLGACAVHDLRSREVPDWLTLPAVLLALVWRLVHPDGWYPWALAVFTVALTLTDILPGGDMKGLAALALFDPHLYLLAWLGAGVVYLLWRLVRRERWIPGYAGFFVGGVGWLLLLAQK